MTISPVLLSARAVKVLADGPVFAPGHHCSSRKNRNEKIVPAVLFSSGLRSIRRTGQGREFPFLQSLSDYPVALGFAI
jgi:hypothetical protein